MPKHWTAPRLWPGETCFIIGGGPSLAGFDFDRLRGRRVIAINASAFKAPFADVCFYGDDRFGFYNCDALSKFAGLLVTVASSQQPPNALVMRKITPPPAIANDPDALVMRRTSTQAAINLAFHFGVARIVLLGVDMKAADDGRTHHHEPHPWPSVAGCWNIQMQDMIKIVPAAEARKVEIVNTSLESLIHWWPKRSIDEVLNDG